MAGTSDFMDRAGRAVTGPLYVGSAFLPVLAIAPPHFAAQPSGR